TRMHLAGLTESPSFPWGRKVTFDQAGRMLTDTDATGRVTSHEWSSTDDKEYSTTDPANIKSTIIYDSANRPTDHYGPADTGCFAADRHPSCANVGHTQTTYDGGISGLAATYWNVWTM